jgi:PBP1b-binding outer membrane lipoprotein LpoB
MILTWMIMVIFVKFITNDIEDLDQDENHSMDLSDSEPESSNGREHVSQHYETLRRQYQELSHRLDECGGKSSLDLAEPIEDTFPLSHNLGIRHNTGSGQLSLDEIIDGFRQIERHGDLAKEDLGLKLMETNLSLDWAAEKLVFDPVILDAEMEEETQTQDMIDCFHYLDHIHVQAKSYQVLTTKGGHLDLFILQSRMWESSFKATHDSLFRFSLANRTFFLGKQERLKWFIVMHPTVESNDPVKNQPSVTKMKLIHATQLHSFIIHICTSRQLYHTTINSKTHTLHDGPEVRLNGPDFHLLQQEMMNNWMQHMQTETSDPFWHRHHPCFHAYDYGMNSLISEAIDFNAQSNEIAHQLSISFITRFNPRAIKGISFAIATELELTQSELDEDDDLILVKRALLGNAQKIQRQFKLDADKSILTIFPIAFSNTACNFQAKEPPRIIERAFRDCRKIIKADNDNEDIVSHGDCQGYNIIKQQARKRRDDFKLSQGYYTAAYCLPIHLCTDASYRRKANQAKSKCRENEPFEQLDNAVKNAESVSKLRFRIEPTWIIDWQSLKEENQNFRYLARNIINPLCKVWNDRCFMICEHLLDPYSSKVTS